MSRLFLLLVSILTFTQSAFTQENNVLKIKDLELKKDTIICINFFYVPWELKPYGRIGETNVRDYNGLSSYFKIDNIEVIQEFEETLSALNFKYIEKVKKKSKMDVRMVIDFQYKSGKTKTILINPDGLIKYNGNYFWGNYYFLKKILEYVPEAEYKI
ncbi:MAG: hypothetical protein KBB11_10325 [Bacteroidales bacterium]|nr:hypothetical protein [Bacteroidales bacterium]HQP04947.1 hypothetical protein [Bacteroidales bacterium]